MAGVITRVLVDGHKFAADTQRLAAVAAIQNGICLIISMQQHAADPVLVTSSLSVFSTHTYTQFQAAQAAAATNDTLQRQQSPPHACVALVHSQHTSEPD